MVFYTAPFQIHIMSTVASVGGRTFAGKHWTHILAANGVALGLIFFAYHTNRLTRGRALALTTVAVLLSTVALHMDRSWTEEEASVRRAGQELAPRRADRESETRWVNRESETRWADASGESEDEDFAPSAGGVLIDPPAETRARAPGLPTTGQLIEGITGPLPTFAERIAPVSNKRIPDLTHRPNEFTFDPREVVRQMQTSTVSPEAVELATSATVNSTGGLIDDLPRYSVS